MWYANYYMKSLFKMKAVTYIRGLIKVTVGSTASFESPFTWAPSLLAWLRFPPLRGDAPSPCYRVGTSPQCICDSRGADGTLCLYYVSSHYNRDTPWQRKLRIMGLADNDFDQLSLLLEWAGGNSNDASAPRTHGLICHWQGVMSVMFRFLFI